jgi:hypothetical protein
MVKNCQLLNRFFKNLFSSPFLDARSEIWARNAKYFLEILDFFSTSVDRTVYMIICYMFLEVF